MTRFIELLSTMICSRCNVTLCSSLLSVPVAAFLHDLNNFNDWNGLNSPNVLNRFELGTLNLERIFAHHSTTPTLHHPSSAHASGFLQTTFSSAWRPSSLTTFNAFANASGTSDGSSTRAA